MVTEPKRQELRRHPRLRVSWPAIVEAGNRLLHVQTLDVSPFGAKVRLDERLEEGIIATLHLRPPQGPPLDIRAIVWRTDEDGPAFFFIDATPTIIPAFGVAFGVLQNDPCAPQRDPVNGGRAGGE